MDISIIVIFHNMRREAARTLYSLTREYQKNLGALSYEVIAIDNGSRESLDPKWVTQFGKEFQYHFFSAKTPSPCQAINYGVQMAQGRLVMLCIDGARILSPGILHLTSLAAKMHTNPLVYTLAMHIGNKLQNRLVEEGYSQSDEDKLLGSIDWQNDGYSLFDVSVLAGSSNGGYLKPINESNCIALLKETYTAMGGFDERFSGPGGGLTNLDFFIRANQVQNIQPVMLLGEATFHQLHGGTATNVPMKEHPWQAMEAEYRSIRGIPHATVPQDPTYLGKIHPKSKRFVISI